MFSYRSHVPTLLPVNMQLSPVGQECYLVTRVERDGSQDSCGSSTALEGALGLLSKQGETGARTPGVSSSSGRGMGSRG